MSTSMPTSTQTQHTSCTPRAATSDDLQKLTKWINAEPNAMFCTIDACGQLHSRPMCVNGDLDCTNPHQPCVWFFTLGKSLKVSEMESHGQQVNLAFSNPSKQTWMSLSGVGSITKNRTDMEHRWKATLKEWFPNGLETPDLCLLKVCINQAEYWDVPSSMSHAVTFIKSHLTGKVTETGTHEKLTMEQGAASTMGKKQEHKEQARADEAKMADVK